ncbi:hypothetical protein WFS18_02160 [Ureaplasma parvum]|uniref:Uncharacterized protein n=3 Tax=Ureaplasma parvum TaxID=134821 RepID=A0AAC9T2W2_UREPR|nr:hypothetical protein [Ureaplasma parvum]pir/E82875/ hypothetical protein UU556 [imported] - Ureaplasma urealyticum [Ureaplasma urealyticum]AAF30969.1 unique hypothetical [Ureaplasma parvum serovar 3 str. ATCC 700970]ACA32876.1 conserved hypothetical protein [Ureaplasma parvum serovar 3 str. ATCC 27815]ASD24684.1 hypothetical protein CEG38_02080 [Ureaplasma parvum]ASD25044.1 hypothetical protein CEE64_01045 [Ureaplasma parvum]ASD29011.1 hypothetical protein CEG40_02585 [Ureaplasma parvum]
MDLIFKRLKFISIQNWVLLLFAAALFVCVGAWIGHELVRHNLFDAYTLNHEKELINMLNPKDLEVYLSQKEQIRLSIGFFGLFLVLWTLTYLISLVVNIRILIKYLNDFNENKTKVKKALIISLIPFIHYVSSILLTVVYDKVFNWNRKKSHTLQEEYISAY